MGDALGLGGVFWVEFGGLRNCGVVVVTGFGYEKRLRLLCWICAETTY